jgi:hypothetical protein
MEILKAVTLKPFKPEASNRFTVKAVSYLSSFEPNFILSEAQAVTFRLN